MVFAKEKEFEEALIRVLFEKGWEHEVLHYPTEGDLIKNWANILFENNRGIDQLNNVPLTDSEMQQILEQITKLQTPLHLNGFINGKTVAIRRDAPEDTLNFGKEVSLKIYDRQEIAAGQSRYQIAEQPVFARKSVLLPDRRGDFMLLINGMPVIHVELKRSGIPVSQACFQIEKYAHEGVFSGIFSLVQIFVAMEPAETVYFANPGPDGVFNHDFYFHWADFNNEPINAWKDIASSLLSIPMAHQLIGFYTVADASDGILKVMRSYQYYAASAISDQVAKTKWDEPHSLGGYIWHTTGSGKTMTSFKSAQLIAASQDADKVVFLIDRIELGTQSLEEYRAFAEAQESIQDTENTYILIGKLKSSAPADTLIVTSIQKMSNIKDDEGGLQAHDIEIIRGKRVVFIVDEAHRSTFGDMLRTIKTTFSNAIFFGFTGTPIQLENQKKLNTTSTIFGNELHRYSIADGIRDKNVLGFDLYQVATFKDRDVRKVVALYKAKAANEAEALSDEKKKAVYLKYMDSHQVAMAGRKTDDGGYVKGIEDDLPGVQYRTSEHQEMVVRDILDNWLTLSQGGKFHAIFATSSIPEAIAYYRMFKAMRPELKGTALFDPSIDNIPGFAFKEDGLLELIADYNARYDQNFNMSTYAKMKKDISLRLAHKKPYQRIADTPNQQIDLLIVVNQMLTGFDSKWVNTLYLDKLLEYENIIQAFSRTNRLFGPEKPFGMIRYYRRPHTMERNINQAIKLYSGDKPLGLFVPKLKENLQVMNTLFGEITAVFTNAGIGDFSRLPEDKAVCGKFAMLFKQLNDHIEAAKLQGFCWDILSYSFDGEDVMLGFDQQTYLVLVLRYKELFGQGEGGGGTDEVPFDLDGHITEIETGAIDAAYMDSRFNKYIKTIQQEGSTREAVEAALDELHKTFAILNQEEQKYANVFLHDVQRGDVRVDPAKTLRDYIAEYQSDAKEKQIKNVVYALGVDRDQLETLLGLRVTETNINDYGRFTALKDSVDKQKAKSYFEKQEGKNLPAFKVNMKADELLRKFLLDGDAEL